MRRQRLLALPKLREFADNLNETQNIKLVYYRKTFLEKCWLLEFSPKPTLFSKVVFLRVFDSRDNLVKDFSFAFFCQAHPLKKFCIEKKAINNV